MTSLTVPQPYSLDCPASLTEEAFLILTSSHIIKDFELIADCLNRVCQSASCQSDTLHALRETVEFSKTTLGELPNRSRAAGRLLKDMFRRMHSAYMHAFTCHANQLVIYGFDKIVRSAAEALVLFGQRWKLLDLDTKPFPLTNYRPLNQPLNFSIKTFTS